MLCLVVSVNTRIQKFKDSTWPFKNIAQTLQNADLTIINLESPFITDCQPTDTGMIFCADPEQCSWAGLRRGRLCLGSQQSH